ncbi:hypothetical protein AACH10_07305 [Ideonella sp. DXS22W]|uniref:Lipoprotein n=1 Tax=Pseudaquabacterium inlustre TaxID=2984192 RepID=A0ABU9CDT5_9BURK
MNTLPDFDIRDRLPRWIGTALLGSTALLSACGGGGGASTEAADDGSMPAQATARFTSSQDAATALVRNAEQHTRNLQLASGLAGAAAPKLASAAPMRPLGQVALRHALAVQSLSAELCAAGTATIDVADSLLDRFVKDPNALLQAGDTLAFSATACTVKAAVDLGDVALGDFGVGAVIDGRFTLKVLQRSGSDLLLELTYAAFSWQPVGQAAYPALDATIRFGTQAGQAVFSLDVTGIRFLSTPEVIATSQQIQVSSGSLRGRVPASAGTGHADYGYKGWIYATSSGRADAGTVTLSGAGTDQASIVASASGYQVSISSGGSTRQYSVAR